MNGDSRIERTLPLILEDLGRGTAPDYVDSLLGQTAAMRQRPGWTFIERWLPMSALTQRLATAPRVPLRAVALVALLILALAAAALYVGSQPHLPDPFGPAGNGVIPYVSNGDIYVGDLATGTSRLLVGDPADEALPQFSPDGTKVAFIRVGATGTGTPTIDIYVVRADGSDVKRITPQPIADADWKWISWTPDGRRIAVVHKVEYSGARCAVSFCFENQLDLFDASGNGSVQRIAAAAGLDSLQFRPPDGREVLISGHVNGSYGLYAMNADGTNVHPLLLSTDPESNDYWGGATYAADGGRIFYTRPYQRETPVGTCCALWVMNADGSDAHQFVPNAGTAWDGQPTVSPDGTRIAFWHGGVFVMRADGTGPLIETGPKLSGTVHWVWAPDSSKILMFPNGSHAKAYLLDPGGGPWTTVPWASDDDIDWQRVAPH